MNVSKCVAALALLAGWIRAAEMVKLPGHIYEEVDARTGVAAKVHIGPFLIAPAEVTQAEFTAVAGYNPSHYKGDDRPVENVSWWEAIRYANLRSLKEGLQPCYDLTTGECDFAKNGYRLPTEAEWAYAAADHAAPPAPKSPRLANLGGSDTTDERPLAEAVKNGGTVRVASFPPNRFGLSDMRGNVWEWCADFFNMAPGAPRGPARVLRGGSFLTTTSGWAGKEYRSALEPERHSRYTGFRVVRSLPGAAPEAPDPRWYEPFERRPSGFETATGGLTPLLPASATLREWEPRAATIRAKWQKVLGAPALAPFTPAVKTIEEAAQNGYRTQVTLLQVEPDHWERVSLTWPAGPVRGPLPVVIVPFYDIDSPVGMNLGGRRIDPLSGVSFAHVAASRGYLAVSIRWFGLSYGEGYAEAVANLQLKHPGCTGLGKWVWDSQRLLDYLYSLAEVDRARIGILGWSLGSKMAMYAAAFDQRLAASVAIEGGVGLPFSNYGDYWYLGSALGRIPPGTDQHELIGLIAPRGFLVLAGDKYDTDKSWHYVNAARPVYELFGKPHHVGLLNFRTGHRPTPGAVDQAFDWLDHIIGQARQ